MVYRRISLDTRNDAIRRALIMVHGTNRNADHYFETATAAAFLAGALEDTIVIAPHMIDQTRQARRRTRSCCGEQLADRRAGAHDADLTSFDFVDEILRKLANKTMFPNMKAIVVAGHSAGGQFANRYEMANKVHDTLGVPITYVVANPSSYAWPDAMRPLPQDDADPGAAKDGWNQRDQTPRRRTRNSRSARSTRPRRRHTTGGRRASRIGPGYNERMTDEQLKKQLVERPTTYLLGQVDTLPLGGFDSSCEAMAQGPTRRSRGEAFVKYINETLGAKHTIRSCRSAATTTAACTRRTSCFRWSSRNASGVVLRIA